MKSRRRSQMPHRRNRLLCLPFEQLEARTLLAGDPILEGAPLILSEFVANNDSTLVTRTRSSVTSEFTDSALALDWIELFNTTPDVIDLGGIHLTDDSAEPKKWAFPTGTKLAGGQFLVVYASGADIADTRLDETGRLHTNFRLGDDGEYLALTNVDGAVIHDLSPVYPPQRLDVSYAVPMEIRQLIGSNSAIEYLVPVDNVLGSQWTLNAFSHPDLVNDPSNQSPIGFDRGDGPSEVGESIGAELTSRRSVDFSRGSLIVLESDPFTAAGRVHEWSIYSEKSTDVTPLVLRKSGEEFQVVGVGRTRTSDGSGEQRFDFELQLGSADVEPGEYFFGVKDGDNTVDSAGVVAYDSSEQHRVRRYNGPQSGSLVEGHVLAEGRSYDRAYSLRATTAARLAGPISTDVEEVMRDRSSLYVRFPFVADRIDSIRNLTLQIRYDDGFVAYLNGTEVARSNVDNPVSYDSTAASRPLVAANRYEEINISRFLGELQDGPNTLAIHGLNDSPTGGEFVIDARLQAVLVDSAETMGYDLEPSPGTANGEVLAGSVDAIAFDVTRGFYDTAVDVTLASPATPSAQIYYTTDGTVPDPSNPMAMLYQTPIHIDTTTTLRAAGFLDDYLSSRLETHSYILPYDVAKQETLKPDVMDDPIWGPQFQDALRALPTLSLVTTQPIQVEGELGTSIEWITPDGSPGFQVNAGVEVFGGTAVSFPKRSMRLSFKNIYGPDMLEYDIFEDSSDVSQFDQLLLRAGSHDAPFWNGTSGPASYIRNRWASDRQLEMGHAAPRGRFVHLYLNGVYWGQYHLVERPNAAFMAAHFGGNAGDYDALNKGVPVDGDDQAWQTLINSIDAGYEEVKKYLDVVNYADYLLLEFYGGNDIDWRSDSNWMATRKREPGAGFQFFAWDSDLMLRTGADTDIVNFGGPGFLWSLNGGVQQYPEFRELLAERAQLHFFDNGILTDAKLRKDLDAFVDELEVSIIAETARWVTGYTPDSWHAAIDWIKDTYAPIAGPSRAATVIEQLRHAGLFPLSDRPDVSVDGQTNLGNEVQAGSQLTLSTAHGDIYYTLNGTDPRGQTPSLAYTSLVASGSPVRAYVPVDDSLRSSWLQTQYDDSDWISGVSGVGFDTKQEFDRLIGLNVEAELKDVNKSLYLRMPFHVSNPSDYDTLDMFMQYDDGYVAYLNGIEIARRNAPDVITWNSSARQVHADVEAVEFERINITRERDLLIAGDNVLAIQLLNSESPNVDILATAQLRGGKVTEQGVSPVAIQYTGPFEVPPGADIMARSVWSSDWSTLRQITTPTTLSPLHVSEVMYHPPAPSEIEVAAGFTNDDDFEFIELFNTSDSAINLSDVRFVQTATGGQLQGIEFDFSQSNLQDVGPHQFVIIVEDKAAFRQRYGDNLPVAGQWSGKLSNSSEQITFAANGQVVQQFRYHQTWYPATDGFGASLEIVDVNQPDAMSWNESRSWQASATFGGSPGRLTGNLVGDSNHDGIFDSADLTLVLLSRQYEDEVVGNSSFEEGDWNGDGDFTTEDFIFALMQGNYVDGPRAAMAAYPAVVDDVFNGESFVEPLRRPSTGEAHSPDKPLRAEEIGWVDPKDETLVEGY